MSLLLLCTRPVLLYIHRTELPLISSLSKMVTFVEERERRGQELEEREANGFVRFSFCCTSAVCVTYAASPLRWRYAIAKIKKEPLQILTIPVSAACVGWITNKVGQAGREGRRVARPSSFLCQSQQGLLCRSVRHFTAGCCSINVVFVVVVVVVVVVAVTCRSTGRNNNKSTSIGCI